MMAFVAILMNFRVPKNDNFLILRFVSFEKKMTIKYKSTNGINICFEILMTQTDTTLNTSTSERGLSQWVHTSVVNSCWVDTREGLMCQEDEICTHTNTTTELVQLYCKRSRSLSWTLHIYRVSQEEWTKLRESVPYVELYQYDPKHLYPKLNGYGDNGQRSLKLWQLLHTYWLPNTY